MQPFELFIGLRYTRAKRRNHFISVIALISMLGIALGVTALIVSAGFVRDVLFQLSDATIHCQSGQLQVHRKGFYEQGARSPDKFLRWGWPACRSRACCGCRWR